MSVESKIYAQALADGMPPLLANFIVWQAAFESAGFTSNVFLSCTNINGYKWVNQSYADGPCLMSPEGDFYAKYHSVEQSTHELTQWIRRRQAAGAFPADLNDIDSLYVYATLLKDVGYYGAPVEQYFNGMLHWSGVLGEMRPASSQAGGSPLLWLLLLGTGFAYRKKLFRSIFKS